MYDSSYMKATMKETYKYVGTSLVLYKGQRVHVEKTNNLPQGGYFLIELLVTVVILTILCSLLLVTISKAFLHAKRWIFGIYSFNEQRIECFLNDDSKEKEMMVFATNKPKPWTFLVQNPDGSWKELK